jgi:hypothetical protein
MTIIDKPITERCLMNIISWFFVLLLTLSGTAFARDSYVRGYYRNNGTYVQGYHRTTPDNTVNNNYGTQGNYDPYTGRTGTRPRNPNQDAGEYNQGNGLGSYGSYNYGRNIDSSDDD